MKRELIICLSAVGNRREPQNLRRRNKEFVGVFEFKYLGNTIENKSRNDKCIKGRTETGNEAYEGWNFNFGNTPLDWIQELLK